MNVYPIAKKTLKRVPRLAEPRVYIGIDGEGQTVGRGTHHMGDHRYVFLAAASEYDNHWHVENDSGLDTETCFDFLLKTVPTEQTMCFAYSFGYDLTKILVDIPDEKIYSLFRPDERIHTIIMPNGKKYQEPKPISWRGYTINLQGSKFSLSTVYHGERKSIVLWDIFKFYQSKFVNALKDWKVGNPELHARMQAMKDKRSEFDKLPKEQVRSYCFEECACMATLSRKLVEAHEKVGLNLKSFYGAGSSASAMLGAMNIRDQIRGFPPEMRDAIARAFFGGRFENSVIGQIDGTVYNYDISSAYPYQITFLPCLVHGRWEHTLKRKKLDDCRTAFVRYGLTGAPLDKRFGSWGPFPFRTSDGSICFPIESGGGWVGKEEYLAGERLFPHVVFNEAWIYKCDCDCQPFKRIPEFYKERIRIGKEGPGIVLKLGYNACYGKLAQSVGGAIFASWIWASLITSGTRAQILDLLGMHKDWSNLLMIATDGVYTREKLEPPIPRDTDTWVLPCPLEDCACDACKREKRAKAAQAAPAVRLNENLPHPQTVLFSSDVEQSERLRNSPLAAPQVPPSAQDTRSHSDILRAAGIDDKNGLARKPLGGWEEKVITKGVFVARPGIYFPMNPTDKELKDVRGRGVGKGVVLENWRKIVDHWEKYKLDPLEGYPNGKPCVVSNVSRFCGAKSSISRSVRRVLDDGTIEWVYGRANGTGECAAGCVHAGCGHVPSYGQWIMRPVEMGFHPRPKRERLNPDGLTLEIRKFAFDLLSAPYKKAIQSEEARELEAAKEELLEQPDADFTDADIYEMVDHE
jgi:hypothetical protein